MRVMIAQPTEGLTEEEIRVARRKVIAQLDAQGHEVWGEYSNLIAAPAGVDADLWRLGRALQDMAGADAVYFMDGWAQDKVCRLEYEACALMGEVGVPRNVFLEEDGRIIQEATDAGVNLGVADNNMKILCSLLGIEENDLVRVLETDPEKLGGGLGPNGYYGHCIRVSIIR